MKKLTLPEFQEFLRTKSLVKEKYIPFYANWASKFLAFSKNEVNLSHDLQVQKFLDLLKGQENIADWQIKQADDAVQLYVNQFMDGSESQSCFIPSENKECPSTISKMLGDMREALRIKHYAYRTEIAYLDWVEKFYNYTINVKKKDSPDSLDSIDVRNYLSHLALKQKVASSS
jgi:hypothetical protein